MLACCGAVLAVGIGVRKVCCVDRPRAWPELTEQWLAQEYALDENEVIRLVAPPWPKGRRGLRPVGQEHIAVQSVADAVIVAGGPRPLSVEFPESLRSIRVNADCVFRRGPTAHQRKLEALASILSQVSGKEIVIDLAFVEREVIVAQGKWSLRPLVGVSEPDTVHLHHGMKYLGLQSFGNSGTLAEFLRQVEWAAKVRVVDEVDGGRPERITWEWTLAPAGEGTELKDLLASMEGQTSLRFVFARRRIPMWMVRERGATTQPGGGQ